MGIPGFKALRLKAQARSNQTWNDIYHQFQLLSGVKDDEIKRLQKLELEAEVSVSYLITETYLQIQEGDILVSDMYLPGEAIAYLLRSVGFRKKTAIYVSPAGKATGRAWIDLKEKYDITLHVGDNHVSDFISPNRHGINAQHYLRSQANFMESIFHSGGAVRVAALIRRFRLTNPYGLKTLEGQLYEIQSSVNLPFLLLMSRHLKEMMNREGLTRLLFTTRDSCLLQPVFKLLFPETETHTFHTSRIAFTEQRPDFVAYVKRLYEPNRTLIFDLHGAFKSARPLFEEQFGALPRVHIFSFATGRAPTYTDLTFDEPSGSHAVELLNLDRVGTLINVDKDGRPLRSPISPALAELGAIYRTVCARFIETLRPQLEVLRKELSNLDLTVPWSDIHRLIRESVSGFPALSKLGMNEHKSLTQIMNEAQSDKGSTYACAHCYTFIYERLLHDLGARSDLTLLEIGLNRDGRNDIPSLKGWRSYLGPKARLYGADINSQFSVHHDPKNGIHILTMDQSKRTDLVHCGVACPTGYDIIIDDGSHMSSHQQTSLSVLWQFLRPGGLYIIEDLHYQPQVESVMGTRELLKSWKTDTPSFTPFLSAEEGARIRDEAASIEFYDSLSQRWGDAASSALVVIRKQFAY